MLLLPTFMRRPAISAFVTAAVAPISALNVSFASWRNNTTYRLNHNGQVCYLRAVLNDLFDPDTRRIVITDMEEERNGTTLFLREVGPALIVPRRAVGRAVLINRRGFVGASGYDFLVCLPSEAEIDIARLRVVVNTYKLASKRYGITFQT